MTRRRKSCKTCKKAATSSLPFMDMSIPVVDGVFNNNDHKGNRTPGFRSHAVDTISDPATAGTDTADAALGRTEPTPGLRKTAKRKLAIQRSSFTAVAQQTPQQIGAAHDKDNSNARGKAKDNCASGDNNDPKNAARCSDEHASKAKVAVSVTAPGGDSKGTDTKQTATSYGVGGIIPVVDVRANDGLVVPVVSQYKHDGEGGETRNEGDGVCEKNFEDDDRSKMICKSVIDFFSCEVEESDHSHYFFMSFSTGLLDRVRDGYALTDINIHIINTSRQLQDDRPYLEVLAVNVMSEIFLELEISEMKSLKVLTKNGKKTVAAVKNSYKNCHLQRTDPPGTLSLTTACVTNLFKVIAELRFLYFAKKKLRENEALPLQSNSMLKGKEYHDIMKNYMDGIDISVQEDANGGDAQPTKFTYPKLSGSNCSSEIIVLDNKRKYKVTHVFSDHLYGTNYITEEQEEGTDDERDERK